MLAVCTLLLMLTTAHAQYDFIRPVKDSIPGGYNFWVYTPLDYYYSLERTPVIIFLHGQSLCGRDLNRVRRYGPLDAIVRGREIEALVLVPQNPGGAWNPKKINDVLEWAKRHYAMDSTRLRRNLSRQGGGGYGAVRRMHVEGQRGVGPTAVMDYSRYGRPRRTNPPIANGGGRTATQAFRQPLTVRLVAPSVTRCTCSHPLYEKDLRLAFHPFAPRLEATCKSKDGH